MSEETAGPSEGALPPDAIFELLAHYRRRAVLTCLHTHDSPLPLADVAAEVAVHEREEAIDAIPAEEVKRVHLSLYHIHVPKLADHDVVAYDQDRNTVALTASASPLVELLQLISDGKL